MSTGFASVGMNGGVERLHPHSLLAVWEAIPMYFQAARDGADSLDSPTRHLNVRSLPVSRVGRADRPWYLRFLALQLFMVANEVIHAVLSPPFRHCPLRVAILTASWRTTTLRACRWCRQTCEHGWRRNGVVLNDQWEKHKASNFRFRKGQDDPKMLISASPIVSRKKC